MLRRRRRPAPAVLPNMLPLVNVGHKSLGDYATIATRGLMDEIRGLAEPLAGRRVLHLSATAFGGGVAEINYTLVPLMVDAGLEVEVADAGTGFEVGAGSGDPEDLAEGGLGIAIIRAIADEFELRSDQAGSRLRFAKVL